MLGYRPLLQMFARWAHPQGAHFARNPINFGRLAPVGRSKPIGKTELYPPVLPGRRPVYRTLLTRVARQLFLPRLTPSFLHLRRYGFGEQGSFSFPAVLQCTPTPHTCSGTVSESKVASPSPPYRLAPGWCTRWSWCSGRSRPRLRRWVGLRCREEGIACTRGGGPRGGAESHLKRWACMTHCPPPYCMHAGRGSGDGADV